MLLRARIVLSAETAHDKTGVSLCGERQATLEQSVIPGDEKLLCEFFFVELKEDKRSREGKLRRNPGPSWGDDGGEGGALWKRWDGTPGLSQFAVHVENGTGCWAARGFCPLRMNKTLASSGGLGVIVFCNIQKGGKRVQGGDYISTIRGGLAMATTMVLAVVRKEQDIRFLSSTAQIKTLPGRGVSHTRWGPK